MFVFISPDESGIMVSFCCLNYVCHMPPLVIEGPVVIFCRILSLYLFLLTSKDNFRFDTITEPWLALCNPKPFCFQGCKFI